jgi:TonB-linked SusC/RagA family outer membrane protein
MQPRKLILCLCILLSSLFVTAQQRTVTGKVSNKQGLGITGATITGVSSKKGTVTDNGGFFSFTLPTSEKQLNVISLGFISKTITIGNDVLEIVLDDDPKQLSEVVVTAYGIKKETKKIGYAVQEVKGSDVNKVRDANPVNALVGKVAGLSVGASSEMLGRPEIVLRGSKDLLFVIDGVPVNSDTWNVSPDDIETYSVLKGANAAALYGSRGINGAIIITTKRGTKEKKGWQVEVNTSTVFEKGLLTEPASQTEYGRGTAFKYSYGDVLYDNKQRLPEWGPRFEGQLVKQYDSPWDPVAGVRTATPWTARGADNFHKFLQTGIINTNNISLSSATEKSDMRISVSNMNQKGVSPNTKLNIYNLFLNAGYNITSKLRAEASINLNRQNTPNIPDVNYGPNSYMYMFKVYGSVDYDINDLKNIYKGPQGVQDLIPYAQEYGRENSAWFIAQKWLRSHDKTDINGYVKLNYKINTNLSVSLRSQITTWSQLRTEKVPAGTNLNTYVPWYYFGWYGDYREDQRNLVENNNDLIFNFDKKFKDFTITALAGGASRSFNYNSFFGTTKALAIPNLYSLSNSQTPALSYTWGSKMQVYSGFYSIDFAYKKYFTFSHTGRVDNLSTLPSQNATYYYPSVSLSTVVSDYVKLPEFISFFKVRGSYADVKSALTSPTVYSAFTQVTGQSTNGGLLGYGTDLVSSYDGPTYTNQNSYSFNSYYNNSPSVNFSNVIANPNIKPANRVSSEAGFDLRFLKNRIGIDFTYFVSDNGPLIYQLPVASSTGYSSQNVNGITTRKKGIELSITASPLKSATGLNWDIAFNYSRYKETLKEIYGSEGQLVINNHAYKVGDRMDAIYGRGFVNDGQGNIIYSGGLALAPPSDINNLSFLGYANPDYNFGINNKFSYKNFTFSFQFDGRIGGVIWDEVYKDGMNGGTAIESATGDFGAARLAEWQTTNGGTVAPTGKYIAKGVKIVSGTPIFSGGQITNLSALTFAPNDVPTTVQTFVTGSLTGVTQYWMTDRSFVKLREISLGYTLPASMFAKNKVIKSVSVALIGRNLLYWAARKDFDLDQFPSGYNDYDRSLSGTSANGLLQSPTGRRFGFNINVVF